MKRNFFKNITVLSTFAVAFLYSFMASASVAGPRLAAVWNNAGALQDLKSWTIEDLTKLKQASSREKDPHTGKIHQWKGVLLSSVVDHALKDLTPDRKAQIDLVILKNDAGEEAMVPRSFIVKYPMLLALSREKEGGPMEPPYSVAPWTSKAKVLQEGVPVESFFVPRVSKIEFANYRERYGKLFLKRRTDPLAMRGEKFFMQNCVVCHSSGSGPSVTSISSEKQSRGLASAGHPSMKGVPKLTDKERRALSTYLDAFRAENSATPVAQK